MALLEQLERMDSFTEAERAIADYVLSDPSGTVKTNISDLAALTATSKASIIRLCRKLGFKGFRDFKIALSADIERSRVASRRVDADNPFDEADDTATMMSDVAELFREALGDAYASVSPEDVDAVARAIYGASHVYLYATGDSLITAMGFANMLVKIGIRSTPATLLDEALANTYAALPGDVGIFISYSGSTTNSWTIKKALRVLNERHCTTVFVSAAANKPAGFDLHLRFPKREGRSGKVATFYSQMCIRYILSCVYSAVWSLDAKGHRERSAVVDDANIMGSAVLNS